MSNSGKIPPLFTIPKLRDECIPHTTKIKPGVFKKYYKHSPFKFIYQADGKEHHFHFHVGLIGADNDRILLERPITYSEFGISSDTNISKFDRIFSTIDTDSSMAEWFLPLMITIRDVFEYNITEAIIKTIEDNATPDGSVVPSRSEIYSNITHVPSIRRKVLSVAKRLTKSKLIEIDQAIINKAMTDKNPSMDYGIYFTFAMKDGVEPYTAKRILNRYCEIQEDGTIETRYFIRGIDGAPLGGVQVDPPFHYVREGGRRTRKSRGRRNAKTKRLIRR